ncbi:MAG: Flp pilus assembly complex ATPase component TadA [Parcubacteria group bacterium]|nr:Flp pilus assembly complex ATPase component TadA [Parcubacteria group bacterium]
MALDILNYLIQSGLVQESQLQDLPPEIVADPAKLEAELLKRKLIKPGDMLKAKSAVLGVPFLDLTNRDIGGDTLKEIPEDAVTHYRFLPIERQGEELIIGMVDPEDVEAREALKFIAVKNHFTPKIYLISESDFNNIAQQYRAAGREVSQALEQLEQELGGDAEGAVEGLKSEEKIEQIVAEAPITKVVAVILRNAVEGRASDIHIEPLEESTRVRFRLDGVLFPSLILPKATHNSVIARIKVLANLKIDETRMPQDGRFHAKISNKKVDFRVSSFPTAQGEKIVLRILDPSAGVAGFEDLGFVGHNMEVFDRSLKKPYGVVLIAGPTGSGKSTTLYTALNSLNKDGVNIITLEDPVEYYIAGVNQSQIKPEIGYTFASGLRSILRQDPNIIMVGEIRDKETAGLAIHAALTGHLVFSTIHTNSALGIIPRLVDMDIDQFLLPSTLVCGLAQRLIKKLCRECAKPVEASAPFQKVISETLAGLPEEEIQKYNLVKPYNMLFQAPGCAACGNKGTKGRLAIYEIFEMTKELEKMLEGKVSEATLAEEAARQGMITMKQDGIMKALLGLVSIEEVLRAVEE